MSSRNLVHACITGFFVLAILWVMGAWGGWAKEEKIMNQLLAILLIAVSGGLFVVMVVLPRFGDAVGTAMFSSGEEVAQDGGIKAAALIARGDYEGAIGEYEKVLVEKPDEPHPVSEMAKTCAEKLKDPVRALHILKSHLEGRHWSEDNAAFLMFRMVDIHTQQHEFDEAKDILEQIAGNFPGTRHSANAKHRINEVEQAQFKILQAQRAQGGSKA